MPINDRGKLSQEDVQIGFIKHVALPLFEVVDSIIPGIFIFFLLWDIKVKPCWLLFCKYISLILVSFCRLFIHSGCHQRKLTSMGTAKVTACHGGDTNIDADHPYWHGGRSEIMPCSSRRGYSLNGLTKIVFGRRSHDQSIWHPIIPHSRRTCSETQNFGSKPDRSV